MFLFGNVAYMLYVLAPGHRYLNQESDVENIFLEGVPTFSPVAGFGMVYPEFCVSPVWYIFDYVYVPFELGLCSHCFDMFTEIFV